MMDRTGYPDSMSDRDVVRLKDLKGRKGHLCQGGTWDPTDGPICGCGAMLYLQPDFMDMPPGERERVVPVPPPGDHTRLSPRRDGESDEAYLERLTAEQDPPDDDDPPPWDTSDAEVVHDELGERGQALTASQDGYPDMNPAVPPIDPTTPYGPAEVERAILDAVQRLERGLKHEANLIAACDQLKLEYDLAYARAIERSTGGAADVRKANAVLACEREYRAYMEACAARDAMKAVTHTLRATLSGLQSVGRSVGVTYQAPQGRGR